MIDSEGFTTKYYYDFTERLMKYVESGTDYSHSVAYTYDLMNNLTGVVETINGTEFTSTYGYNDDNVLTSVTNGSDSWTFGYDDYGRLNAINSAPFNRTYNYKSVSDTQLTAQLASIAYPTLSADQTYAYTYDDNGNIVSVTFGGYTYSYVYDSQNQLIRENNSRLGRTYTWTYDNAGNILSRTTYAYTTGALGTPTAVLNYRYEDPNWGDLLTGINNNVITYDAIGNMLTFGARSFTWEHGRQLASQTINGTTWTYTYNADGMRTGRTNGTNTYEYVYNGSQLMQMTRNGVVMNFTYINGIPATISYGGNTFYYVVNGQGDVTGITDSQGIIQVTYYYDAWGATSSVYNPDSAHGLTLTTINPLRYRGYVFDWEVGLYYLQSRYYIPEIGRFLNPDNYPSTGQGVIGNNMFAYCGNNPVSRQDEGGEWWNVVIGAVVGGVVNAVSTWASGGSLEEIVVSAACGAVSGAIAATGAGGLAGQMLVGAATSAIDSGYQNYNDYKSGDKTLAQAIGGTVVDSAMGATFGAMGYEGKSALKTSNKVAKNTKIARKTLKTKGLNPKIKARANATVRDGRKYFYRTLKDSAIDSVGTEMIGFGVSKTTEWYIGYLER